MLNVKLLLWILGGAALIIGLMFIRIEWLKSDLETEQDKVTGLTKKLAVSDANTATLKAQVARQNIAIDHLKAKAKISSLEAQERAKKALSESAAARDAAKLNNAAGPEFMNQFFNEQFP